MKMNIKYMFALGLVCGSVALAAEEVDVLQPEQVEPSNGATQVVISNGQQQYQGDLETWTKYAQFEYLMRMNALLGRIEEQGLLPKLADYLEKSSRLAEKVEGWAQQLEPLVTMALEEAKQEALAEQIKLEVAALNGLTGRDPQQAIRIVMED